MRLLVEVVTLVGGCEKRVVKEIETTSTVRAVIDVLQEQSFTNVQSISVDHLDDAVN